MYTLTTPLLSTTLLAALAAIVPAQTPLTTGNLVAVRVGDGSAAPTSATQAVFLDEFTPAGVLVQSIPLPTSTNGAQRQFTLRGNASSEGYLNVSTDGRYLLLAGYDAPVGAALATTEGSPASTTPRVIARIERATGVVDTSTALVDAYDGSGTTQGNVRSAVSDDGSRFWVSGTGIAASAGVRFVANLGDSTSVRIGSGAPTNTRVVGLFDGQLYTTSASTVYLGVCEIGMGQPTTGGQLTNLLPGFPTAGGTAASSAYDFFFADPETLYVADDNATSSTVGGINKWTWNGTTWVRQYRLQLNGPNANTGARGLSGYVRDGIVTLWATANTSGQTSTTLITVTDTGPNSVVTTFAAPVTNTVWKGVRHLAKPTTALRLPVACGNAGIRVSGNAETGTELRAAVTETVGVPILGISLNAVQTVFCGCTFVHDFVVVLIGGEGRLTLPNDAGLVGLQILYQGVDFGAPGGCIDPAIAVTDGVLVTVQ